MDSIKNYEKQFKVVYSCKTPDQLENCKKYIRLVNDKYVKEMLFRALIFQCYSVISDHLINPICNVRTNYSPN